MKHKFTFFAVMMMALAMPLQAQNYDFSAVAPSGQTLYYGITPNGVQVIRHPDYTTITGGLTIPAMVTDSAGISYNVTAVGDYAFTGFPLTSVTISTGISSIGNLAFKGCPSLVNVMLPDSLVFIGGEAFQGCPITSITIPRTVTSIGSSAFKNCTSLTTVNFNADSCYAPASSMSAIFAYSGITNLNIGSTVRRIPGDAFAFCYNLTNVIFPNSLTYIGEYSFWADTLLTSVVIPDSVRTIADGAFYYCTGLANLVIGSGVDSIGMEAFVGDTNISSIELRGSVPPALDIDITDTMFGDYHFYDYNWPFKGIDSSITVTVPCGSGEAYRAAEGWNQFNNIVESCDTGSCDTVQLPYLANFNRCWTADNGAVVNSPQSVSLMGQGQKIESPWIETLPGNVFVAFTTRRDGEPLWDGTEDCLMTVENEDGEIYYTHFTPGDYSEFTPYFTSPGGLVRVRFEYVGSTPIPSFQLTNVAVFQYPMSLTIDCPGMASVGDTVTAIFRAELPDGDNYDYITKEVYEYATGNWIYDERIVAQTDTSLSFVINTAGRYGIVSELAKFDVFAGHTVRINEWVDIDIVDYHVFYEDSIYYTSAAKDTVVGCHPQLHNAHLPGSVRKLNYTCFNNHRNLQSIVIEDGLTDIEYYSFLGCSNLASVSLPGTLTHIGRYAFGRCSSLERIDLPQSLTALDEGAFWYCTALDSLVFPDHIRTLGRNLMDSCISLTYVHLPDSLEYADTSLLRFCTALRHVDLPQHINRIEGWALMQCHSLESLDVPEGVTSIGETALYNDFNLAKLRLPSTLRSLGNIAMAYCQSLDTIWVAATTPPACTQNTFSYANGGATLVVPCGTAESYRSTLWSYFNIVEDCGTEGIDDVEPMSAVIAIQNGAIVVEGAEDHPVSVYDINGRLLATAQGEHAPLQFNVPASGTYLVKVGDHPARRVVVVR
ncbi:MAG: leucine-rich repeat protein [Bacteroidales bacterium]|nr:leucine-rich repeat protein [Bacteroidales bacterium]